MSKHNNIRHNKTCQNCGRFVHEAYCPKCGQENTDSRPSFSHLVQHFVADLIHYDSTVWSTTKLLLFSPATLSKKYLSGKRRKYVDPIKLYIFISFIAFFIPSILPQKGDFTKDREFNIQLDQSLDNEVNASTASFSDSVEYNGQTYSLAGFDSLFYETKTIPLADFSRVKALHKTKYDTNTTDSIKWENKKYAVAQFDSLYQAESISFMDYNTLKILNKNKSITKDKERQAKIKEFITHNLSKVLFIYMPIFAFWLWIFHSKKKFWYFDSAIFTLHYFSFVLLLITIVNVINTSFMWLNISSTWNYLLGTGAFIYAVFYYFRAHRIFYGQKRWIANTIGLIILNIDLFCISITFVLFALLAFVVV